MHTLIVSGLVASGLVLYVLVMVFVGRFVGFNRLPSG